MLQSIRKGIGSWVAKAILGILILSFALFFGFGDFANVGRDPVAIEVGSREVTVTRLQREMRVMQNRLRAALDAKQVRQAEILELTVRQMIDRGLLDEAADSLGLAVPDAVIRRQILTNPAFQNAVGDFDRLLFERALANAGMNEQTYVATSRGDTERLQIIATVTSGGAVPEAMVKAIYRYRNERRVAEVMVLPHASFTDIGTPDEAALAQFHSSNAEMFTAPEYRKLVYITLAPEDLLDEVTVPEEDLRDEYEFRLDEYVTPERREVEQMVFDDEAAARAAHQRLLGGEDFAAVAGATTGLSAGDRSLGLITRDDLPREVADAVFALGERGVSEPLESPFGWHLFHVAKIEPGGTRSLDEVRPELLREMKLERAGDALFELANKVEDELASGASLEAAAQSLGLELRTLDAIDRSGRDRAGEKVADLFAAREFLEAAFGASAGIDTPLIESEKGGYFVLRVDRITPPALRPLDAVRDQVVAGWTAERQSAAAEAKAKEIAEAVKGGADLPGLGQLLGYEVRRTAPLTRDAFGADPAVSPGTLATLFTLSTGDVATGKAAGLPAHVVAQLADVRPADPAAEADAVQRLSENLRESIAEDLVTQYRDALAAEYPVSINQKALSTLADSSAGDATF